MIVNCKLDDEKNVSEIKPVYYFFAFKDNFFSQKEEAESINLNNFSFSIAFDFEVMFILLPFDIYFSDMKLFLSIKNSSLESSSLPVQ